MGEFVIHEACDDDIEACVELWVQACAERDGARVPGVAERARAKFPDAALCLVARAAGERSPVAGFALATIPGSGMPGDPKDAAVLGLLAVSPDAQGSGLGRELLGMAADGLSALGHRRAVLHVLTDNVGAVRLYRSAGWQPFGEPFEHALLHRASQAYELRLGPRDVAPST